MFKFTILLNYFGLSCSGNSDFYENNTSDNHGEKLPKSKSQE
jgi:hypothetical protein